MDNISIGVSLLNGEIRTATFRSGGVLRRWEQPAYAEAITDIGALLLFALQNSPAEGKRVAIVLAHPKLTDQVVEVPPVKGWKLDQVVQRRAEKSKTFVGDVLWSQHPALPTKTAKSVLLHLCPKTVIDQLLGRCEEAQLQLVRVVPTTSVLIHHLSLLPLEADELALLAAETGDVTTLVIGRKDRLVCLGRIVRGNWTSEPDRVNVDLTRSIGFAEQQTGLTVKSAWLFGASAPDQVLVLQSMLKLPVSLSPVPYSDSYWAEEAAQLPTERDGNLLSREVQKAPERRRYVSLTRGLLAFAIFVALLAATGVEVLRQRTEKSIDAATAKIADLRMQKVETEQLLLDRTQMVEFVRAIKAEQLPVAPAWMLGYLSEIVPDTLVVTEFLVRRTNNFWQVRLAGASLPGIHQATLLRQGVFALSNSLVTGPFHVVFNPPPPVTNAVDTASDEPDAPKEPRHDDPAPTHFQLEGWIR